MKRNIISRRRQGRGRGKRKGPGRPMTPRRINHTPPIKNLEEKTKLLTESLK